MKEARKAVRVRDLASVVNVWDVFYENETAYIVMEYIRGVTLKDFLIKRGAVLDTEECREMLLPVIHDLQGVHEKGIVHRDISPDNLMVREDGKVMLLDLGAAKDLTGGTGQSSFVVAKKGFSPPEQCMEGGEIGPWTDVYAMCATIYWCMTGKLVPEALNRMMGKELGFPESFPSGMASVLRRGLAVRPADRIRDMGELEKEIRGTGSRSPAPSNGFPVWLKRSLKGWSERPEKRKPVLVAAVLAIAAFAAVAVIVLNGIRGHHPSSGPDGDKTEQKTEDVAEKPEEVEEVVSTGTSERPEGEYTASTGMSEGNKIESSEEAPASEDNTGDLSSGGSSDVTEETTKDSTTQTASDGATGSNKETVDNPEKTKEEISEEIQNTEIILDDQPMEITDSWDQIIVASKDGTYKERYRIGDTKELDLGEEGIIHMKLVAMDADELADGSGKAPMTWIAVEVINSSHYMNKENNSEGGWPESDMRAWLREDILPLFPENVKTNIKEVIKYSRSGKRGTISSIDTVWIPSYHEVSIADIFVEEHGPQYTQVFSVNKNMLKHKIDEYSISKWWIRSDLSGFSFIYVDSDGSMESTDSNNELDVVVGFCL